MRMVVSYDIGSDRRRRKVAEIMEGAGYRVQYSVFECDLDDEGLKRLQQRLRPLVSKRAGESVRFYPLCAACRERITVVGHDGARELGPVVVV